jgi:hypothetical protein
MIFIIYQIARSDANMKEGGTVKRIVLKRLLLLAAMVLVAAIPATVGLADTSTSQNVGEVVSQDSELESESGEIGQTFEVTGGGDNSDQCAGVQGVGNTAPVQGGTNIIQYNSEAEDFEFEDVGGSLLNIIQADSEADNFEFDGVGGPLTVDGTNETTCEQEVNQAGSASG